MEQSKIIIKDVVLKKNRIDYEFSSEGNVSKYFNKNNPMFIEYTEDISSVPKGIAIVPLLTNILPIAWLNDSEIYLDELDENFYNSIKDFKKGYKDMYPHMSFNGKLICNKIIKYNYKTTKKTASFFSGGVDSTSTLFTRINEKPDLITLWGSDIFFDDIEGWNNVKNAVIETANTLDLKPVFIKSSFRKFINEGVLNKDFAQKLGDYWWHGIQHGIGIIGHSAPYAFLHKLKTVYFPSTHYEGEESVVCASYPTIDNNVRFGSTNVYHEGFNYKRQDKIRNICRNSKMTNNRVSIRVCWKSKGGRNCCDCEKCARTIFGLISEGEDPINFGFEINEGTLSTIKYKVINQWVFSKQEIPYWVAIQENLNKQQHYPFAEEVEWINTFDFENINKKVSKKVSVLKNKSKAVLASIVPLKIKELIKYR